MKAILAGLETLALFLAALAVIALGAFLALCMCAPAGAAASDEDIPQRAAAWIREREAEEGLRGRALGLCWSISQRGSVLADEVITGACATTLTGSGGHAPARCCRHRDPAPWRCRGSQTCQTPRARGRRRLDQHPTKGGGANSGGLPLPPRRRFSCLILLSLQEAAGRPDTPSPAAGPSGRPVYTASSVWKPVLLNLQPTGGGCPAAPPFVDLPPCASAAAACGRQAIGTSPSGPAAPRVPRSRP